MAGNRHDDGRGADPRHGWGAPQGDPYPGAPTGVPEYFTAPHPGPVGPGDQPGHTRAFAVGEQPYGEAPYGEAPYGEAPYGDQPAYPYGGQDGYGYGYDDGYGGGHGGGPGQDGYGQDGYGQAPGPADNVAVYRAGGQAAPHAGGPRLPWRQLLVGMYRSPSATFDRMRDHQVWLPALCVSLLYGVLAVFALDATYDQVVHSAFAVALWAIGGAALGFTLAGGVLSAVTYVLARQFGGDGPWQSTVGLAALISWTTDAPRLLLALFLPIGNPVVQAVGWATWVGCAVLLTVMVRRIHDLPWGKAAGAAAVQLLALLVLIKLPTLG
ncbi:Yip1 family protein [Kitasatospora sp. YST-16]|uniref:Yip1 family protein n=1 Tax=Kitasatospora sp. YST-16 TaxID=2998080 RepID=UPI002284BF8C|nr:Yip1 family protein [Kitasatospora sp. YST-16]WAL72800.1 Yip1 family protein [Kitasatospora sp. YST-16]WNW38851.1 Yip1 family protein [Streptomyces sp. Li-HN-5-13]